MTKEKTDTENEKKSLKDDKLTVDAKEDDIKKDLSPEEKILDLEDKLVRAFAEMENQRRRFEKEKDEAFEYGGFVLAKESLNLLDNLERSKQYLENDEKLKNTDALKKIIEHLNIVQKDMLGILKKKQY